MAVPFRLQPLAVGASHAGHDGLLVEDHDRHTDGARRDLHSRAGRALGFSEAEVVGRSASALANCSSPGEREFDMFGADASLCAPTLCVFCDVSQGVLRGRGRQCRPQASSRDPRNTAKSRRRYTSVMQSPLAHKTSSLPAESIRSADRCEEVT